MFANRYQINLNNYTTASTETFINIPINMEFQNVDQAELVNRVFVDVETKKAINPIIDYEKTRFLPINLNGNKIAEVKYLVDLSGATTYGAVGFTDEDIKFKREVFKQTFLSLNFYDSDNPLSQNLITSVSLFSELSDGDLLPSVQTQLSIYNQVIGIPGQPKPANQIPIMFTLSSPILKPMGLSEGFHLYYYKDEINIGTPKYLYMRAAFNNAKNGTSINMMVKNTALPIDVLIHELYTRYKLVRTTTGFYYEIDDTYQGISGNTGTNNVTYTINPSLNSVSVKLYQIKAL